MYVKLAFSVAAHLDPDILIVDEVLAVGDAAFQKKSLGKMKDVASQGRTVIFVSHNAGSIKQLCNKAVLLGKGEVQFTGTTDEVLTRYATSTQENINENVVPVKDSEISNIKVNDLPSKLINIEGGTKDLSVEFQFNNKSEEANLVFGLGLRSVTDGSLVIFTHNHLENVEFNLKKGMHTITADLGLSGSLSPGEYTLELSCWLNSDFELDSHAISNIIIDPFAPFADEQVFSNYTSLLVTRSKWKKQ